MENRISICGSDCSACYCYAADMCKGCHASKGMVFHCPEGEACAIYHCCVTEHGYLNCSECDQIPCALWRQTRDPKFSDAEFERNIEERIAMLQKNI